MSRHFLSKHIRAVCPSLLYALQCVHARLGECTKTQRLILYPCKNAFTTEQPLWQSLKTLAICIDALKG